MAGDLALLALFALALIGGGWWVRRAPSMKPVEEDLDALAVQMPEARLSRLERNEAARDATTRAFMRRMTVAFIMIVVITSASLYRTQQLTDAVCANRVDGRADVRSFGVALTDRAARFAKVNAEGRAVLRRQVQDLALDKLPAPDC